MRLLSAILFAVSVNLDSLVVGISYGIKKQHISFSVNLFISLITCIGTLLSIGLGLQISSIIPTAAANFFGSALLILLGVYYILKFIYSRSRSFLSSMELSSPPSLSVLSLREAFFLGGTLMLNNIGLGIGASITGIPLIPATISTFVCCVCFLDVGNRIGKSWLSNFMNKFADLLSGFIILLLGLYGLFT